MEHEARDVSTSCVQCWRIWAPDPKFPKNTTLAFLGKIGLLGFDGHAPMLIGPDRHFGQNRLNVWILDVWSFWVLEFSGLSAFVFLTIHRAWAWDPPPHTDDPQ